MAQRAPTKQAAPAELLTGLQGGYDGYTDPTAAPWTRWAQAVNVFSGAFGFIQRCRFANVVIPSPTTGLPYTTLKYFALPGLSAYLMADVGGKLYSFDTGAAYARTQRLNPYVDPSGAGSSQLNGPWSREALGNILYEMNGQVKQAGRLASAATIEGWGLDAPDSTPQVAISAGSQVALTDIQRLNGVVTAHSSGGPAGIPVGPAVNVFDIVGVSDTSFNGSFLITSTSVLGAFTYTWSQIGQDTGLIAGSGKVSTDITKSVGRSYMWAWENANKFHVGAPSPATQYIQYINQNGLLTLIQPGTITVSNVSTNVTGVGTQFTSAWVGRSLTGTPPGALPAGQALGRIVAVISPTQLTLAANPPISAGGLVFQVYDPQATHIRLYETGDGGATYFRVARNAFFPTGFNTGLQFSDLSNAEPPNFPFTTETAQINNLPPPIGAFLNHYQGRICVFGIPGAGNSFFYSNIESTTIGLPQESFAPLNQVTLPIQNGVINGMLEFPGSAIIWSNKQDMFRLTGLLTDNTIQGEEVAAANAALQQGAQITQLPYNLGCASPFACEITPLGGVWLTPNAEVWLFTDRYAPRNIGRPVQDILSSCNPANLGLARMKYYHTNNRNWLTLEIPANSGTYNNTLLVLDIDLLASNGSPSYFTFDMATNAPAWYILEPGTPLIHTVLDVPVTVTGSTTVFVPDSTANMLVGTVLTIDVGTPSQEDITILGFSAGTPVAIFQHFHNVGATVQSTDIVPRCDALEAVYEANGNVRLLVGQVDLIQDVDAISGGLGTEVVVPNGSVTLHAWGNDSAYIIKRPGFVRFNTNRDPSLLASDGWSFQVLGIDDDFYTFTDPLVLDLAPGVNDSSTLGGNPDFFGGLAFRHSPELYRIGGVNFVMGRRLKFVVNFPVNPGVNYQLRGIQLGIGANPPS